MTDIIISVSVRDTSGRTATQTAVVTQTAASSWPSAATTGVPPGTTLTNSGSRTITTAGAVVQNLNITGQIIVKAANVTIKNCRINAGGNAWGIDSDGFNANVQDCEIFNGSNSAILGQGGQYLRLNLHGFDNGVTTQGGCLIQDCYIHDLGITSGAHVDGVSIQQGSNTVVRHNRIESWDTSCVFIKNDFGPNPMRNHIVDNNLLINTPGKKTAVTVYSVSGPKGSVTGTQFTNNIMEKGNYSPFYWSVDGTVTWTNNRDYVTGALIAGP